MVFSGLTIFPLVFTLVLDPHSAFFKEMFSCSIPSSSAQDPLPITETSEDLEVMLFIITGRPNNVVNQSMTWQRASNLYRMMDKYGLDGHQPWFSGMCGRYVKDDPLEALFLACKRPCIDTMLARYAIADGFPSKTGNELYREKYFLQGSPTDNRGAVFPNHKLLAPRNMKAKFGLRLGFKGLLAYNLTFATLDNNPDWKALSLQFVENALSIEEEIYNPSPEE